MHKTLICGALLLVMPLAGTAQGQITFAEAKKGQTVEASSIRLGGIPLGARAMGKDKFNRALPESVFAILGSPTAVAVPVDKEGKSNITIAQQPPGISSLLAITSGVDLPQWAKAVTLINSNYVSWLYKRDTCNMAFSLNPRGIVETIVVAGISAEPSLGLKFALGNINLGDDIRKVRHRYGEPKNIKILPALDAKESSKATLWHYDLDGEHAAHLVFTMQNNRVVRIQISS